MIFKGIPCTVNTLHDFIIALHIDCLIIHFFLVFRFLVNDFTPAIREAASLKMIFGTRYAHVDVF